MRTLPPVHSPLTARALARAAGPGKGEAHLRSVEERIRDAYRPLEVSLTDTGTSALRLALEAASSVGNAPVAMPAYNCYDLVSAVRGAGITPIYYDVDPATLGPDQASLMSALESGARSVVVAYLFGVPIELEPVRAACDSYDALLIEDAAQGVGGSYRNRPLGAHGDLAVLSFARGKGRTGGGGGALLANSEAGRRAFSSVGRRLPAAGGRGLLARAVVQWTMSRPTLYALPRALPFLHLGEARYREPRDPAAMSPQVAALLAGVWDASEAECEVRRALAGDYGRALGRISTIDWVRSPAGSVAGYLRFPVVLQDVPVGLASAGPRWGVVRAYPKALPDIRPHHADRLAGDLPGARLLTDRLWTLPVHRYVSEDDASRIVSLLTAGT